MPDLGVIGRMGLLMTPDLGPRVRISVVSTNMPLIQSPSQNPTEPPFISAIFAKNALIIVQLLQFLPGLRTIIDGYKPMADQFGEVLSLLDHFWNRLRTLHDGLPLQSSRQPVSTALSGGE